MSGGGYGATGWGAGGWGAGPVSASFANLSFEIGDGLRGALAWRQESLATGEDWAVYGAGGGVLGVEAFEGGWGQDEAYTFGYGAGQLAPALYSAHLYAPAPAAETFEAGWRQNQHYMTTSADMLEGVFGPATAEGFEIAWGNSAYERAFVGGDLAAASYANGPPQAYEPFERIWRSNDAYVSTWAGVASSPAAYAGLRDVGAEDFEYVRADAPMAMVGTDGTINIPGHGLSAGYRIEFAESASGTLPLGLSPVLTYYVKTVLTSDTFNVALTPGGAVVVPSDAGTGVNYGHEPYEFWTEQLGF